jgi:16S rRNA (adenine1518-N6/adenine1519-N6)-dimethyltransferase
VRRAPPLLPEEQHRTFEQIVKLAFSQRRKIMAKLLKQSWPAERLAAALNTLQVRADVRAEKLSLEQFVALTRMLADGFETDNERRDF